MHVDVQVMWLIRKLTDWAWEEVWLGGLKNAVRQPLASGIVGSVRLGGVWLLRGLISQPLYLVM